jgi:hypothetical protein
MDTRSSLDILRVDVSRLGTAALRVASRVSHETITTRFELTDAGHLVEHSSLETHDRRTGTRPDKRLVPVDRRKNSTAR